MLATGIIYPIDNSEWESPIFFQPKKHDPKKLRFCVDFLGMNKLTVTDPFQIEFVYDIINEVVGPECYSFINDFSRYNQVSISKQDQEKTTIFSELVSLDTNSFFLALTNSPIVFSRIVVKEFQEYMYRKMLVYLDD